jgi:outer membrane protein TolC
MIARWFLLAAPFAGGCVAYEADPADAATVAAEARQLAGGRLTCDEAFVVALHQNPELLALEARARAAGAITQPLDVQSEYRSGTEMVAVMLDPVALLGLGSRGAAATAADATAEAALVELAVARWRTTAAVAEAFALEAALAALRVPDLDIDAAPFERSGLASSTAAHQLRAAQARMAAESLALARERAQNLARLRDLLGLPATTVVTFAEAEAHPVVQPAAGEPALLQRPDVALAAARFRIADAEFRRAVADQYPSVMLGPEFPLGGGPLEAMAVLRLPLGMAGLAVAADLRRDAARAQLTAAYLQASNGADRAEHELTLARAAEAAAAAGLRASTQALAVARVALQVDVDPFAAVAEAASMVARDTMEHRAAVTARVRAEVQRAMAYGWPLTRRPS